MPPKRKLTIDQVALNRLSAVEETGTEHFERDLSHDEEALSFLRRIDFGQTVEADAEKESELVKEWPWQGLCENLVEAQGELNIIMDLVDTVQANIDVDVAMLHRPRRLANEELSDKAISLSIKLLTFNRLSKYLKQSGRSLSQKVSREATFYGALMRLQRNWKVRQKKYRTVGTGENSGFVVVLSNDVLRDLRLPFHLLSFCMVDLDQDTSGMLTTKLPKHSRRSFHVVFNQGKTGHLQREYTRKMNSSIAPFSNSVDDSQIGDQETGRAFSKGGIGEGVDEGSKRAQSVFREILSEIFDLQVFGFVMSEIDGVNPTRISENFLRLNLSPEITLTLCLEPSPSDQDEKKKNEESVSKHSQKSVDSDFNTTDGDIRNQIEDSTQEKNVANREDQQDNKETSVHNQKSVESDVNMTDGDIRNQTEGNTHEKGAAIQEDQKDNKESSPVHNQKPIENDADMTDGDIRNQTKGNTQEKSVANQEDQKDNKESSPVHNQKSVENDVDMTDGDIRIQTEGNTQEKSVANQEDQKDNNESSPVHNQKSVESDVGMTDGDIRNQNKGRTQEKSVANEEDQKDNKESSPVHNHKSVESDVDMTDGDIRNQIEGNTQEKSVANQEDQKDNKESSPAHNQKSVESDGMTYGDIGNLIEGNTQEKSVANQVHNQKSVQSEDSGHQMESEAGDKKEETCRLSRQKKKHPTPLSSEVYLQQIILRKVMGLYIRDKGLMMEKAGKATTGIAVGEGEEALPSKTMNVLRHFCLTLSHRIFSYKVLDELENMLHIQYLCLVSHPTWAPYTSAWFLYLDIPETVIFRVQTKVSEFNEAQKNVRLRYYCKIVVHKESLTIEGGPTPCVGGLFLGTATEVPSISEYRCGLDDLALFLLQQVASQILHWLHEEVRVYKEKVKRDFLGLSFEVDNSRTITLVANIDVREYDINWLLVVKDIFPEHVTTNFENTNDAMDDGVGTLVDTSGTGLERKFLGSLKLEDLYDIVLDLVTLCR